MNNEWHPCRYIDCTLEHDDSWVDGKWNEQDIVQALADHFNVDRAKVNLTVKIRTEGYGPTEHQFPEVSAVIKEG